MYAYLISNNFIRYEGDAEQSLYLIVFNGVAYFWLGKYNPVVIDITSNSDYIDWLVKHHKSLLMIDGTYWYNDEYHTEYLQILEDICAHD